jgi:hypothetical protein
MCFYVFTCVMTPVHLAPLTPKETLQGHWNMKLLLAYCMGLDGGCGTASKDVKCGTMSDSNRMNAPLFPIWSQ